MRIVRQHAFARAALVGNPSDGYHGRTISLAIRNFRASVIVYDWERIELLWSQEDQSQFDSIDSLVQDVKLHGYYGGIRLIKATIKRFAEFGRGQAHFAPGRAQNEPQRGGQAHFAPQTAQNEPVPRFQLGDDTFSIRYETTIPRQVGMAGSSAIVVATLKGLMEFYRPDDPEYWDKVFPKHVRPSLALSVERDELGISAGLQDRVIQVYGGLVSMDFTPEKSVTECGYKCGIYEPLDPSLLPPLYVAYTRELAEPGERTLNPLWARYKRGDEDVLNGMSELADYARRAREAIVNQDHKQLAELIDKNFEVRRRLCNLDPNHLHVRMVDTARSVGASANFTGSGGAIIGTYDSEETFAALQEKLGELNCVVFRPDIAGG